ncbi:MAG: DNA alkylation repair protein [Clostridia bacterium]|nr:DNA alkylation repair protein [Clostridia bacterium]
MTVTERLFSMRDDNYAVFQAKLLPTVSPDRIIGVRIPALRKLASDLFGLSETDVFLKDLPHYYYDENVLHGLLISKYRDYGKSITMVGSFLPYIDNWAVCDTLSPVAFKKHREELKGKIDEWLSSDHTYTVRFGIDMLMKHYLDEDFYDGCLQKVSQITSDEYYINMAVAWFFATALAKQWDSTVPFLENGLLTDDVFNKTVRKASESFRISDERKKYLAGLRK